MQVFHFSEDSTIRRFEPVASATRPGKPPVIWAIDGEHAPHYFFPRDCPRICFWSDPATTVEDRERFFSATASRRVIAIEFAWFDRLRRAKIWVYDMPPGTFALEDATAGYFVSSEAVTPLSVEPLGDPLERLARSGVELRLTPSLAPLRAALIPSTIAFSMIRLRNAAVGPGLPDGR